ncbi:hypothetical protein QOT17_006373, partial [Balamuthia mandrillaris]
LCQKFLQTTMQSKPVIEIKENLWRAGKDVPATTPPFFRRDAKATDALLSQYGPVICVYGCKSQLKLKPTTSEQLHHNLKNPFDKTVEELDEMGNVDDWQDYDGYYNDTEVGLFQRGRQKIELKYVFARMQDYTGTFSVFSEQKN